MSHYAPYFSWKRNHLEDLIAGYVFNVQHEVCEQAGGEPRSTYLAISACGFQRVLPQPLEL